MPQKPDQHFVEDLALAVSVRADLEELDLYDEWEERNQDQLPNEWK